MLGGTRKCDENVGCFRLLRRIEFDVKNMKTLESISNVWATARKQSGLQFFATIRGESCGSALPASLSIYEHNIHSSRCLCMRASTRQITVSILEIYYALCEGTLVLVFPSRRHPPTDATKIASRAPMWCVSLYTLKYSLVLLKYTFIKLKRFIACCS